MAGALAAAKLKLALAHVEAGLRSFQRNMPEEINRVVADHCSTLLFAPTEAAIRNLCREGISGPHVKLVGDVMYDVSVKYRNLAVERSDVLAQHGVTPRNYILATVHRAANTDDPTRLRVILDALTAVSCHLPVIFPVHPRTRAAMERIAWPGSRVGLNCALKLTEPVGYLDMIALESQASVIVTDSGGVQKEAFFYKVPCVTVREETEWLELVELGWNRLAPPTSTENLAKSILSAIGTQGEDAQPYGDGHAADKIADVLSGL